MSSNRYTNEQLEQLLKERAGRLVKLVELKATTVAAEEIGMVVAAARLLYGKEVVDKQIDEFWSLAEAREAGLCERCREVPVLAGFTMCPACLEKVKKFELHEPNGPLT